MEPVAEDDETLVTSQRQVNQEVTMPKEVVIDLGMLEGLRLRPAHEPLLFDIEVIILIGVRHFAEGGTLQSLLTAAE